MHDLEVLLRLGLGHCLPSWKDRQRVEDRLHDRLLLFAGLSDLLALRNRIKWFALDDDLDVHVFVFWQGQFLALLGEPGELSQVNQDLANLEFVSSQLWLLLGVTLIFFGVWFFLELHQLQYAWFGSELVVGFVILQDCLHLELVSEPGCLAIRLHGTFSGVYLFLASRPVDFECLSKVLGVGHEEQTNVQFNLILLARVGSRLGAADVTHEVEVNVALVLPAKLRIGAVCAPARLDLRFGHAFVIVFVLHLLQINAISRSIA